MDKEARKAFGRTLQSLNLSYLHAVQELARLDLDEVRMRFGLSREAAEQIRTAPLEALHELANPMVMVFKPRLAANALSVPLTNPGSVPRARFFSQILGD